MKVKLFILTLVLSLGSLAFGGDNTTNMPATHWSYPYLKKAAAVEIDGWWLGFADKETTRLNLAQILARYLTFLEKKGLVGPPSVEAKVSFKDIPRDSEYYHDVAKVTAQYQVMLYSSAEGSFMKTVKVTDREFVEALSRLMALCPNVDLKKEEREAVINQNLLSKDFGKEKAVKRYEVVAALVKLSDFLKKPKIRHAAVQGVTAESSAAAVTVSVTLEPSPPSNRLMIGGMFGYVYEGGPAAGLNSAAGGKLTFEHSIDNERSWELVGAGSAYGIGYLVPSGISNIKGGNVLESKVDAQINYKNIIASAVFGGNIHSSLGFRSIFLNNETSATSLVGLRGGIEYIRNISEKMKGKMGAGLTAKLFGEQGRSILGALTSAVDYGLEVGYGYFPNMMLSLNYDGDALVFNQQNVRYFNSVTLINGWRF